VVLGGDLDLVGFEVLDRLIRSEVAELEFERASAEGLSEQLVAEADAENRNAGLDQLPDCAHDESGYGAGATILCRAN